MTCIIHTKSVFHSSYAPHRPNHFDHQSPLSSQTPSTPKSLDGPNAKTTSPFSFQDSNMSTPQLDSNMTNTQKLETRFLTDSLLPAETANIYRPISSYDTPFLANRTFLCYGRFMTGSRPWFLVLTLMLILIPSVTFSITVLPHAGVSLGNLIGVIITPILFVCLLLASICFCLRAAFTEPGVIPRRIPPGTQFQSMTDVYTNIEGIRVRLKWCGTCGFHRPPRASHCRVCDGCVDRWDHCCIWVSNCIGLRNYKWFYFFLISTTVLAGVVFGTSCNVIIDQLNVDHGHNELSLFYLIRYFICVYSFISVLALTVLSFFHTYLVFTNKTTREWENDRFSGHNPFNKGICQNVKDVLFTAAPPSNMSYLHIGDRSIRSFIEDSLIT